ncbi:MAG: aminotransferase class IV [Deltaproteobacteria bacterium]|nr:aminotransferase class IV [Deltaproteobacteria bacterium]MBW2133451.1 aminotransferase class IV [Deltaproteobacteria bacterium]
MSNERKVWRNGKFIPWEKASVPLLSHGFSRGSAIFEVFGIHEGPEGPFAFRMDEHLKRLMQSARLLGMEMAYSTKEIVDAVAETVKANHLGRGLIKILAYWGEEAIIQMVLESKLDLAIFAIPDSEELGLDKVGPITACLSKWRKIHPETVPVAAKSCANYLNGYLARRDANRRGFDVGLLVGTDGFLAEGSIESVFLVKDGVLKTPPLGRILSSITRKSLLQAASTIGIPTSEDSILPEELFVADEIFTSHSGIKVSPVARFEDRTLPAPGPISRRLIELMENILHFRDDRFKEWLIALD